MKTFNKHITAKNITDMQRGLFVEWFGVLLGKQIGHKQSSTSGNNGWIFYLHDDTQCKIEWHHRQSKFILTTPKDISNQAEGIAKEALDKARANDSGEATWWFTGFGSHPAVDATAFLHMARMLGDHRRFQGSWRLGDAALLTFTQNEPDKQPGIYANQSVKAIFCMNGPGYGPIAYASARDAADRLRTIVAFATGAAVDGVHVAFPAEEAERNEAQELLTPSNPNELHIDGFPVWPAITALAMPDEWETLDRIFGALLAYEHGLTQKTSAASLIFFVTAIEALTVPNTKWKDKRIVKRFQEFLELACPEAVDEIIQHSNFAEVFGNIKGRKKLTNRLYSLRSHPVHTGDLGGLSSLESNIGMMRIAFASELARKAIIAFLRRPLSLLWGHPTYDPPLLENYTDAERALIRGRAQAEGKTVEEWIRHVAIAQARVVPASQPEIEQ